MTKRYLGDAVYFDVAHGSVVLTTSNGIRDTNTIVLEPGVVESLLGALATVFDPAELRQVLERTTPDEQRPPWQLRDEAGVELVEPDDAEARGFAVWDGCEGEDPRFVAFFVRKDEADGFVETALNEDGERRFHDHNTDVGLAILTERGIVSANDFTIETHEQLVERIKKWEASR